MTEILKANILANFAYFRRSRLLYAFIIVFFLLTGLSSVPALFIKSIIRNFDTLHSIAESLAVFLFLFSAVLGLFVTSSHLRNRSLKMVFTKPCSPALWLFSAFLSASLLSLALHAVVLFAVILLAWWWHLAVVSGLVFLFAIFFAYSVGIIAYLMLLGTIMHPAIAVVVAILFNASIFYSIWSSTLGMSTYYKSSRALHVLERLFYLLYMTLPISFPFSDQMRDSASTLRVMHGEWKYPAYALGYSLALSAFCYCVGLFALQRRKHI
jgi:hypothetical protein